MSDISDAIGICLVLGFVSGLRTFTALAVIFLMRGGLAGIVLSVAAVAEYVGDLLPKAPARTGFLPAGARFIAGAASGYFYGVTQGFGPTGAAVGAVGALMGTFLGYFVRMIASEGIGNIPAGLAEDVVAIALAFLILRLG